jgi:hypothetical protein
VSIEQYQKNVNSLDNEIAELEKKKADVDSKIADINSKIQNATDQIRRTKSVSTVKSKTNQVNSWNKELTKKSKDSADYGKKIADKRKKRNEAYLKLQKEQQQENKKQSNAIKKMQDSYERRIDELMNQIAVPNERQRDFDDGDEDYDVFVSHAWEDKEDFVDEFVVELQKLGIKVWYDKEKISWGDSMRARIDDGLKKSKFGIAIISPNYIAPEKYWTKAELDGLFQLESINGKVLLPVWHNITKQQILNYSPIIANKKAMSTAMMTASEIAVELKKLLESEGEIA